MFYWLVLKNSILTRDTQLRRGGTGDKNCVFCSQDESTDHLFLGCSAAHLILEVAQCAFGLSCSPSNIDQCIALIQIFLKCFDQCTRKLWMSEWLLSYRPLEKRNRVCFRGLYPKHLDIIIHTITLMVGHVCRRKM